MPRKLTQKEFEEKVFGLVGNKYKVISQYNGKTKPVTIHCNEHNCDFTVTAECFMRGKNDIRSCCPECSQEKKNKISKDLQAELTCAYCGEKFFRLKSKLSRSKSGLYFCCREHKDLAQRISSGADFDNMRPEHYNNITKCYRVAAFREYPHECAICGYNEDETVLEVHHIDENRQNNNIDNLIILCPICHKKLTTQKYILVDRDKIIPKN